MPKMLKHSDYVTHIKNGEDVDVLTRKLFDVNMRLFQTSPQYKKIILDICEYLIWQCKTEKEGYKLPHGFSGANAGIPFNIISYRLKDDIIVMINPKITRYSDEKIVSESNCGSLTLNIPITIERSSTIDVSFYDMGGNKRTLEGVNRKNAGLTIQHEVDHNLGVLIYDRKIK